MVMGVSLIEFCCSEWQSDKDTQSLGLCRIDPGDEAQRVSDVNFT